MDKAVLDRFISKYNLNGAANSVILKSVEGKGLSTKFITDDKNALGYINCPSIELEEGEYAIYETDKLRSLLGVLDNDIKLKVVRTKDNPTGFSFSDENTKVVFVLSNKENIPPVPNPAKLPEWDIVIEINQQFLNTFVRAKGALPDVDTFALLSDGKKADVILGYHEKINTNRVSIKVQTEKCVQIEPIAFSATYLRDILSANKEMTKGRFSVSSKGLALIEFDVEGFDVHYYLAKKEIED